MAVSTRPVLRTDAQAEAPLPGIALQVLCGLAWLGVAWAFSFLDRARDAFGGFALAWTAVGALGFGLGLLNRARQRQARRIALVLTVLACVVAVFPGILMYSPTRWAAFGLLLVTAARAAAMHLRRDLYYALAAVIAVSLLVVAHDHAEWTVWFYLAPAWLCVALALAWDHAAGVRLGATVKAASAMAFLAVCMALGLALSALLPLPQVKGFGFMQPPTSHPGRVGQPAGGDGEKPAGSAPRAPSPDTAQGGPGGTPTVLGEAMQAMRRALHDRGLPAWQQRIVEAMLAVAEALARAGGGGTAAGLAPASGAEAEASRERAAALQAAAEALWNVLLALILALLAWVLRWRIAASVSLMLAAVLMRWAPGPSMRWSMRGLQFLLRRRGHRRAPGQSLLEYVLTAPFLQTLLREWLQTAIHSYGGWRFGGARPAGNRARAVYRTVLVADELMQRGKAA